MIYKIIKENDKDSKLTNPVIVEYCITESGKIYLFTEEDLDAEPIEIQNNMILTEKGELGGYPPIKVKYSGERYNIQLIPAERFIGTHKAARVKISDSGKSVQGTRHISFSDDDPICKRGALSVYRVTDAKFNDSKEFRKSTALEVGRGFVYATIDDLEDYFDGNIDKDEMQKIADEKYSKLPKSKQDYYNNIGEKIEVR